MSINPKQMQQLMSMAEQQNKALVEIKAGKMTFDGKLVKPERRKGVIKIVKDPQGMMQF
jgi:hypothetical protein